MVGELDGEEGGGVFEAGAAVGGGGEFYVGDRARGGVGVGGVVEGAAEEIADEEGAGLEGREVGGGDEELLAGEEFGGVDAVAAREFEDDAAGVLAGGEEVLFNVEGEGVGCGLGGCGGREEDFAVRGEEVGEIAEGVGEEFAAAPLRAQQASDGKPTGGRDTVQRCRPLEERGKTLRKLGQGLGERRRRGMVRRRLVALRVVVGFAWMVGATCLDDIEREAALEFHAGCTEDGTQGARCAALLADDFTDVAGSDMEAQHGSVLVGKDFHPDRICIIDEGPGNLRH
jgi:hypothetical protein